MMIRIAPEALDTIHRWVRDHYPEEACGFLIGTEADDDRTVITAIPARNISEDDKKRRFVINPVEYLKAEKYADARGLLLLGVFHSHPDHPALPSKHDLAHAHPFFSFMIVSIMNGIIRDTRSYQLVEGQFVEETLLQDFPVYSQ